MIRPFCLILFVALWCHRAVAFPVPEGPWNGERQYAPDRDAEITHLALDVTPDFKKRVIAGEATLTFKPIAKPLPQLKLNAVDLNIQSVDSTEKIASWQNEKEHLIITFAEAIPADKEARVTIHYSAEPMIGLYFRTPEMGYKAGDEHLFSQGEAEQARYWYPSHDFPNEKFTTEITCHVPDGMTVLSNGRLVSEEKDGAGLVAFHWAQEQPHVSYLVSLVAGYFKKVQDKHGDIPLAFYVPPSDINEAPNSFRDTKDIMEFYESEIGIPYPWVKYYQVVVQDFVAGGMENTSITTLTENTLFTSATENIRNSEGLTSHEMAHQWFGDLVTCKDWSHLWLNEGFATFYALLYDGHKNGRESMLYGIYNDFHSVLSVSNDVKPIVSRKFNDPEEQFNYLPYQKGAAVLQMLRSQLGVELYRQCIKTYVERHKFGNVITENLSAVIEELSGRSYDRFFDQWVYHAHYPELDANYSWDEKTKLAKISISQKQKLSDDVLLFEFPLTVAFGGKSGRVERTVTVKDKDDDFYFLLPEAPRTVHLDPNLALLAKIDFHGLSDAMLYAQLEDEKDVAGRLVAIESLKEKKDHETIAKLKHALNHDSFYGVRNEAAKALQSIHSDESLQALLDSMEQDDARVRNQVAASIAGFYDATAYAAERDALAAEKNPIILGQHIRGLGHYAKTDVRQLLLPLLQSDSYRNTIVDAAIIAMRDQDDPSDIAPIRETLQKRQADLTTSGIASGLGAMGYLGRNEEKKDAIREFLLGYVPDKKRGIQLGAIRALGTLEDPEAISALETYANASKENPLQQPAEQAVAAIRAARRPADNLKEIRDTILDLQKENRKLRKDLESLEKKVDAKSGAQKNSSKHSVN